MAAPISTPVTSPGLSPDAIASVRPKVRAMLTGIPAYGQMTPDEQHKLANDMVKLLAYMEDPGGVLADAQSEPASARGLADDANEQTRKNLAASPGFAGQQFVAGSAQQGTEQFTRLVNAVDFPAFVGGLINNVFQTIVETSIEQMRAYAELVANVAKSAAEYMNDNIGMGQGRDYLADRYPDLLKKESGEDGGVRLQIKADDSAAALSEIHSSMGMSGEPLTNLDEDAQEQQLVNAARLIMAKSRQQLLASMVMLGISRIVVTDGSIVAKVKFDMRANDEAKRDYRAAASDVQTMRNRNVSAFGGGFLCFGGGTVNVNDSGHVATVSTSVDESSDSKLELNAKLQGEVRVNFKTDYLALEKMATPEMIGAIQGNAAPRPTPSVATAGPAS